tara:strand:- start:378 stop:1022 length:645 start_codon:yes stop_codon:yes gene_type:complete
MKLEAYCIYVKGKADELADRCVATGKKHKVEVTKVEGYTPETLNIDEYYAEFNIPQAAFHEKYSRIDPVRCAFASHHHLWRECAEGKTAYLILEHDAVFVNSLPNTIIGNIVNLGKPSYGKYNIPNLGENRLTSKQYLPGAHGYMVTPFGAKLLLHRTQVDAGPTDVFIHNQRFPGQINEVYPWPIECEDSFTTIQNETGCLAKHNYNEQYQIR